MHSPQGINPGRQAIGAGCKALHIPDTPHYQFEIGRLRIKHPTSHQSDPWTPWLKLCNYSTQSQQPETPQDQQKQMQHPTRTINPPHETQARSGGVPSLAEDERNPSRVQTNAGSLRHRSIRMRIKRQNVIIRLTNTQARYETFTFVTSRLTRSTTICLLQNVWSEKVNKA